MVYDPAAFATIVVALATLALAWVTWRGQMNTEKLSRPALQVYYEPNKKLLNFQDASTSPAKNVRAACVGVTSDNMPPPAILGNPSTSNWVGGPVILQMLLGACGDPDKPSASNPPRIAVEIAACYDDALGNHYGAAYTYDYTNKPNLVNAVEGRFTDFTPYLFKYLGCSKTDN